MAEERGQGCAFALTSEDGGTERAVRYWTPTNAALHLITSWLKRGRANKKKKKDVRGEHARGTVQHTGTCMPMVFADQTHAQQADTTALVRHAVP